ncbi:CLAVATA3/ESR (CLE)-related protein 16 [Cannabis sativa]|uniref:CLAVATA3/ESR (CLE)-related protein 16 n=1 Tax=Cannabis sativa TaxID=3483 RepID=UPI0029CAA689|nr:CLAVATA3/ESR (CLE)-related protein 16 [Cannabis sativa]
MIGVMKSKNQMMRRKREWACLLVLLSLLLLVLLQLESSACFAEGHNGKSERFRSTVSSSHHNHRSRNAREDYNKDEVFGVEKRKVYTGPNPLHNR